MAANQNSKTIKHPLGLIISFNQKSPRDNDVAIIKNQLEVLNFQLFPTIDADSNFDLKKKLNEDCPSTLLESYDFLLCFVFGNANTTSYTMRDLSDAHFDYKMLTQHFINHFPSKPKLFIFHTQIEKLGDSDGDEDQDSNNLDARNEDNIGFVYSYTKRQDEDSEFIRQFCQAINSNQSLETIFFGLKEQFGLDLTCDLSHFESNICLGNILPNLF
jgi:hypothetical protein